MKLKCKADYVKPIKQTVYLLIIDEVRVGTTVALL